MNTLQTIYNKLQDKTELAKHEIELSLLDEAEKLNKELNSLASNTRTTLSEFLKFKTKLFVKAYRSYWSYDLENTKNHNILYPFLHLIKI